jgi:hypothetical protein
MRVAGEAQDARVSPGGGGSSQEQKKGGETVLLRKSVVAVLSHMNYTENQHA